MLNVTNSRQNTCTRFFVYSITLLFLTSGWAGPKKNLSGIIWVDFYRLRAFHIAQATVSEHWKNSKHGLNQEE